MNLSSLEIFADVYRAGSLAAAARARDVDPSLISRAIANLEDELGVRLFVRSTRRLAATDAGKIYFDRIGKVLRDLDDAAVAAAETAGAPSGVVRLTVSVSFGRVFIVPLMDAFRKTHPTIVLDLILDDSNLDLAARNIDLAIRLGPQMREGDLIVRRLMRTRYSVYASPGYLAQHGVLRHPAELSSRDCILIGLPGYKSAWTFRKNGRTLPVVPVKGNLMVSNAYAARQSAEVGLGPALLADWICADAVASGALVKLFSDYEVAAISFDTAAWLVYPARDHVPAKTRCVIDFLARNISDRAPLAAGPAGNRPAKRT